MARTSWSTSRSSGSPPTAFAKVGVIDEQDRLVPMADVDGNAFYADAPEGRVKSVVALDEAGDVIWRSPPRTPPDE